MRLFCEIFQNSLIKKYVMKTGGLKRCCKIKLVDLEMIIDSME